MTKAATHHSNDNERDSFSAIGLAALLIVNRLKNENQLLETRDHHEEDRERQTGRGDADEKNRADQKKYVDKRLLELAAFERKASGIVKRR